MSVASTPTPAEIEAARRRERLERAVVNYERARAACMHPAHTEHRHGPALLATAEIVLILAIKETGSRHADVEGVRYVIVARTIERREVVLNVRRAGA